MKLSEAIFIFERYGGENPPAFSDEFDKFELYSYLLKSEFKEIEPEDQEIAEKILKIKMIEYEHEIQKSNKFIELLDLDNESEQDEDIAGINKILKYLTELTLFLASIGVNKDVSIYEAHRLYALSMKNKPVN